MKWRKTYILIEDKKHLTNEGINKIMEYKNNINKLNKDIFNLE